MTRETALKVLRETHDKAPFSLRTALETFIPELVDSEERLISELLFFLRSEADLVDTKHKGAKAENIKKYKERLYQFADWVEEQKKKMPIEWSEEDEGLLNGTLKSLREYQLSTPNFQIELQMNWLRNLRNTLLSGRQNSAYFKKGQRN